MFEKFFAKNDMFLSFATMLQRFTFQKPETEFIDLEPVQKLLNVRKPYCVVVNERRY